MRTRLLLAMIAGLALAGCDDPTKETLQQIKKIDQKSSGYKEALPAPFVLDRTSYDGELVRSPFSTPAHLQVKVITGKPIHINVNRPKQALESYAMDSLAMMGTVSKNNHLSALIKTPDGGLILVKKGSYIGRDHGRVMQIESNGLVIQEAIPDGQGGYIEKTSLIAKNTQ